MNELTTRALTGAAYVALALGAAWAGPLTTTVLFLPVCAIGANEFHKLFWKDGEGPLPLWSIALAVVAYLGLALPTLLSAWTMAHALALAFALLVAGITMSLRRGPVSPAMDLGGQFLLVAYVALPFALLPHLLRDGPELLMGTYFLLWTNDTGAYLVGRAMGRTKLLPAVSPKKTVEGLVGGVLLTLAVAYGLGQAWTVLSPTAWLACGLVVSIAGTVGDLLESALKRARGVKDSGHVLPGHGGILDRFDGMLLAAPAVAVLLLLLR